MIKLVAFDWNGTLFSDALACVESVNEVLKLFNLKPVSLKTFQEHFDVPVSKSYLELGVTELQLKSHADEIVKTFHDDYEIRALKVRARAYAKTLLTWLSENNIKSVIFSNHIDEPIRKQLRRLKIENHFSTVLANTELNSSLKGRNKQQKLKNYIDANNFSGKETLVIGDTVEEIEIGKELGAVTVAITHGFCSIKRLKAANPDYLINNLKQVINVIRKITG